MDGFNLLSVEKDTSKPISAPVDLGIEIIDEEKNSKEGSYDYDQIKHWLFK